jgi:hypothetical protein
MLFSSLSFAQAAVDRNPTNAPRPVSKDVHTMASGVPGWAVVDADGTLERKLNAKSVTKLGVGTYEVAFSSNVSKCAYSATIGLAINGGSPSPGYINVTGRSGNVKALFIKTYDTTATLADEGFHIVVSC